MYCRPRNVTIAHMEHNKTLHSMLRIYEEHPTFKINANFGLKSGNLNMIEPKCNRKIMTSVTKGFLNLFFTVKFHYYVCSMKLQKKGI
jgi:hypothetical protein